MITFVLGDYAIARICKNVYRKVQIIKDKHGKFHDEMTIGLSTDCDNQDEATKICYHVEMCYNKQRLWVPWENLQLSSRSRPFYGRDEKTSPQKNNEDPKKQRKVHQDHTVPMNITPHSSVKPDQNMTYQQKQIPGLKENLFKEFSRRGKEIVFDNLVNDKCCYENKERNTKFLTHSGVPTEDKFNLIIDDVVTEKEVSNHLYECWRFSVICNDSDDGNESFENEFSENDYDESENELTENETLERMISRRAILKNEMSGGKVTNEVSDDEEVSDEEVSDEEVSDEEVSDEEVSGEEVSDEKVSDEEVSGEEVSDEKVSDKEVSDEEYSDKEVSGEEYSNKEVSADEVMNSDSGSGSDLMSISNSDSSSDSDSNPDSISDSESDTISDLHSRSESDSISDSDSDSWVSESDSELISEDNLSESEINVHTNWCSVCGKRDNLKECPNCPACFHVECKDRWMVTILHRKNLPNSVKTKDVHIRNNKPYSTRTIKSYSESSATTDLCPSCVWGPSVSYGDVVWNKLESCPWWPAKVLTPGNLPSCLLSREHGIKQWPVRYYDNSYMNGRTGTLNHSWSETTRMCMFLPSHTAALEDVDDRRDAVMDACDDYISVYLA